MHSCREHILGKKRFTKNDGPLALKVKPEEQWDQSPLGVFYWLSEVLITGRLNEESNTCGITSCNGPHGRWASHSFLSARPGSGPSAATASPSCKGHPSFRKLIDPAEERWECAGHSLGASWGWGGKEEWRGSAGKALNVEKVTPAFNQLLALHHAGEVWAVHLRKWLVAEWNKREHKMFCVQYQK